jgi:hypothetical protein
MNTVDLSGLDRLAGKLKSLTHLDATDLMLTWSKVIDQDNRDGVMAGLDKDGVPMAPVTYRPKYSQIGPLTKHSKVGKPTKEQRGGRNANARKGAYNPSPMGGLSSAEYRLLAGPPLAPRYQFSRVITNLKVGFGRLDSGNWYAAGMWDEVLSAKGVPFLRFHFDGIGQKRRDLRGVRPAGVDKARSALRNWARLAVRERLGGSGEIIPVFGIQ